MSGSFHQYDYVSDSPPIPEQVSGAPRVAGQMSAAPQQLLHATSISQPIHTFQSDHNMSSVLQSGYEPLPQRQQNFQMQSLYGSVHPQGSAHQQHGIPPQMQMFEQPRDFITAGYTNPDANHPEPQPEVVGPRYVSPFAILNLPLRPCLALGRFASPRRQKLTTLVSSEQERKPGPHNCHLEILQQPTHALTTRSIGKSGRPAGKAPSPRSLCRIVAN